jgi:glutaredoxin
MPESKMSLLTHPDCGYCAAVKEAMKDEIANGEIGIIDISTEEGYKIATEVGAESVPNCVEKDDNGKYKLCDLKKLVGAEK